MTRTELRSIIASVRNPNWAAFEAITVSPDLTVFVDRCGEPLAVEESETMVNAMRLASWKRRYASHDECDLPRTAVTRAQSEPITAAIPMRRARS
jgi:hypothetical protein